MRDVTPVEKLVLEKEAKEVGGMIILILGEPGAGKTMALVVMVEKDIENGRIPLWTGQKSCQWIIAAAQGIPVTMWMQDSIDDYQFFTTGSKKDDIPSQKIDLERKEDLDIEFKEFSEPEEIVEDIDTERLNVYYIPGADGGEKDQYFFQEKNYRLSEALVDRRYGDHVTLNADEIQNIAPDKNRKPFYDLQMNKFPNKWQDFRKNNISMRGTGHGYAEINWKYYDMKANGIIYMQGGKVHKNHSEVDQSSVNNMQRGEFVANGFEPGEFKMPDKPEEAFGWIRDHEDVELKMEIEATIPDIRPTPDDIESILSELPIDAEDLRSFWTVKDYAEEADLNGSTVRRKLATNKLPGIKVNGTWLMAEEQLVNHEEAPF
jgi:hypothetical protein